MLPHHIPCVFTMSLVKLLNRFLSGHCFDKKPLYIMKITDNNICNTCNTIENAVHILLDCKEYNHIRIKFNFHKHLDLIISHF